MSKRVLSKDFADWCLQHMKTFDKWCEAKCYNPRTVAKDNPKVRCHHCNKDISIRKSYVNDFGHFICGKCIEHYDVPEEVSAQFS